MILVAQGEVLGFGNGLVGKQGFVSFDIGGIQIWLAPAVQKPLDNTVDRQRTKVTQPGGAGEGDAGGTQQQVQVGNHRYQQIQAIEPPKAQVQLKNSKGLAPGDGDALFYGVEGLSLRVICQAVGGESQPVEKRCAQ